MLAIVPVKGRDGKTRLDGALAPPERARFTAAMLADVLAACREARTIGRTLVVTPDPSGAPAGVDVLRDEGVGHGPALARALRDAPARDGVLVVMGDCPLATPDALDRLAEAAAPVALAPARDGGLNALALQDARALVPAFGIPGAASVTLERARAAGVPATVVDEPGLAFDVDTRDDLGLLLESEADTRARRALAGLLLAPVGRAR